VENQQSPALKKMPNFGIPRAKQQDHQQNNNEIEDHRKKLDFEREKLEKFDLNEDSSDAKSGLDVLSFSSKNQESQSMEE